MKAAAPKPDGLLGANPNDHYGDWKGGTQRATDHKSECRQKISIGLHVMFRHAVAPSSPGPIGNKVDAYG
jgi:hypothetical protein